MSSLVQQLSNPQISDLNPIVFSEEHVNGLYISMENLIGVQVLEAQAHLYEESPYLGLTQLPPHLALQVDS